MRGGSAVAIAGASPDDEPATSTTVTPMPIAAASSSAMNSGVRRRDASVDGATAVDLKAAGVSCSSVRDVASSELDGTMRGLPRDDSGFHSDAGSADAAWASACAIAVTDWKRCSGCFASACRITCSSPGGMSARRARGGCGASSRCARIMSNSVPPANGTEPVTAS